MQALPAITELFHSAGAEVLDERVGLVEQPLENVAASGRFEVERDRLLAAVDRGEIGRFAILEWAVMARVVALPGRLDFYHPRPEFGEQQGAVGTRQNAGEIDYRDAGERPGLRHDSWSS